MHLQADHGFPLRCHRSTHGAIVWPERRPARLQAGGRPAVNQKEMLRRRLLTGFSTLRVQTLLLLGGLLLLNLAADLLIQDQLVFSAFDRSRLLEPGVARRYRDRVLAPGGSAPAATLIENFLGRPFRFDAWEAWLNEKPHAAASAAASGGP